MRIMKAKRAIIILLMIGILTVIAGCARGPYEPGPGTEYQFEITVEVAGTINSYDGIYYIVLDADGNPATGPFSDISSWEDRFYYIKLESNSFYFAQKEENSPELYLTDNSTSENRIQVTIALSDLGDPNSVDINVITTDTESSTSYDYLDGGYFSIDTTILGSTETRTDLEEDSGEGGPNFDIIKVTAEITTLY